MVTGASTADAGRHPGRRPQGRARPRPGGTASWSPSWASPGGAGRQQARPGRVLRGGRPTGSRPTTAPSRPSIGLDDIVCIPISALRGDNITEPSPHTPWYHGPTLLGYLETVEIEAVAPGQARSGCRCSGSTGPTSTSGASPARSSAVPSGPGDRVRVLPSGRPSTVARLVTFDGDLDEAVAGQSVTLTLADEIDVSRGDVLAAADDAPAGGRPVRGPPHLDGRTGDAPGPALPAEDRDPHGRGHGGPAQVQGERQHPRARRRQHAGAQRDRRVQHQPRPRRPLRSLRGEPRDWAGSSSSTG